MLRSKNMHRTFLITTLLLLLLAEGLTAQAKRPQKTRGTIPPVTAARPRLLALARSDQDSIVLRWAPNTPFGWIAGNRLGYIVERITMLKDPKAARATFHRLTPVPVKPWTLDEWKSRINTKDRYEAIAVQALYGKSFSPRMMRGPTAVLKDAADELSNRYGFSLFAADMNPQAAAGLGLRLVDKDIKRGESYGYFVFLAGKDSLTVLDTAFAIASAVRFVRPQGPPGLSQEAGEHSVTLRWNNPVNPRGGFTAFTISRSPEGGRTYTQLNDLPFLTAEGDNQKRTGNQVFVDTGAIDYVPYRYRVEGLNAFGDVSEPAEINAMALDLTPPPPPSIKKPVQLSLGAVRILWDMPKTSPDLAGFVVSRSSFALKNYHLIFRRGIRMPSPGKTASEETRELLKLILPSDARSFDDSAATTREPYYIVAAVDTAGNLAQSLPTYSEVIDTTRPAMPKALKGTIDKNGIVRLHWQLGLERNIIGYRVMWANDPSHEFSQCVDEPVPDTTFIDSVNIRTLSHYVYYRIAAVTDRYIQSPLSAMLSLRRPDVVAPASPVFTDVRVTDSLVMLWWAKSPSDDVAKQMLMRRRQGKESWQTLRMLGPRVSEFTDSAVTQKIVYEYQIEAVDSSGLHSAPSPAVQARPYDSGIRAPVTGLRARYDSAAQRIKLNWQYASSRKEKFWFVIYRSEGDAAPMQYSSVGGVIREFEDNRVQNSKSYKYRIRVVADGGAESPLSEIAGVQIPAR